MNLLFFLKPGLYVSKQTAINGNISTDDNSYVDGTINGNIITKATLVVEKNGLITGNALAKNVIIKGKINGDVRSEGKVDVIKKGEVGGHVYATEINADDETLLKGGITKLSTANELYNYNDEPISSETITPAVMHESVKEEEKPQSWF